MMIPMIITRADTFHHHCVQTAESGLIAARVAFAAPDVTEDTPALVLRFAGNAQELATRGDTAASLSPTTSGESNSTCTPPLKTSPSMCLS